MRGVHCFALQVGVLLDWLLAVICTKTCRETYPLKLVRAEKAKAQKHEL